MARKLYRQFGLRLDYEETEKLFFRRLDDPTLKTFGGKDLLGSYDFDDEGVRATPVSLIEDGNLVSYLLGREPIRDFPESNGHGRAAQSDSGALSFTDCAPASRWYAAAVVGRFSRSFEFRSHHAAAIPHCAT